jgi:hypothetical protein
VLRDVLLLVGASQRVCQRRRWCPASRVRFKEAAEIVRQESCIGPTAAISIAGVHSNVNITDEGRDPVTAFDHLTGSVRTRPQG